MSDPEQGRSFTVAPLLSYHNLGFEYVAFIIETNTLKQTIKLEKLAPQYPYIQYRARCYGASNGLLFQFRIPEKSKKNVVEFMNQIVEKKIATNYQILASDQTFYG